MGYDALLARAAAHGEWQTLTLNIPTDPDAPTVRIGIDEGNGGQPYLRHNLTLDASTGAVESWAPFSSQTTGQKARSWIRFLHTGEALGHRRANDRRARVVHEHPDGVDGAGAGVAAAASAALPPQTALRRTPEAA